MSESINTSLSFVITAVDRSAADSTAERLNRAFLARLERCNSADLIARARQVYWHHLRSGGAGSAPPAGVVLQAGGGRVVFGQPTLLPDELFVPGAWLLGQAPYGSRGLRSRSRSQSA